jgi:hypothetical protein
VKKQFKKIVASVNDSTKQQGEKLIPRHGSVKFDLDEVNTVAIRGEFSDKAGATIEYTVLFYEKAEGVDNNYLTAIAYSTPMHMKEVKNLGDKATEITFPDGKKRIVFKKGHYVVSLGFPPSAFALSDELVGNFSKGIDNAEKP